MGCGSSVGIVVVAFSMVAMTAVVVEADDGHTSTGSWCIARSESTDKSLQTALDYVCGAGADCLPIQQNGLCYLPNTLQAHASYAFNSYYQKSNYAPGACDFAATATITITNPSNLSPVISDYRSHAFIYYSVYWNLLCVCVITWNNAGYGSCTYPSSPRWVWFLSLFN